MKRYSLFLAACVFVGLLIYLPSLIIAQDTEAIDGGENGMATTPLPESNTLEFTTAKSSIVVI